MLENYIKKIQVRGVLKVVKGVNIKEGTGLDMRSLSVFLGYLYSAMWGSTHLMGC